MDKNFVELWKELFVRAAESQRVMENMAAWMRHGFTGLEQMASFFQKSYGFDRTTEKTTDYLGLWKKTQEDCGKYFTDYLSLLGAVPRDQHLSLIRKYEGLKEKVTSQEETINNLRMLLSEEKKVEHDAMTGRVQDLIQRQSEQFQTLMETFTRTFKGEETSQPEKAAPPERKRRK